MTPIQRQLLGQLKEIGPIRGTAQVGYALWPDRSIQPQGAAVAAGKIIRTLRELGYIQVGSESKLAVYSLSVTGAAALEANIDSLIDDRQRSVFDE
jgi:hypothetical protein